MGPYHFTRMHALRVRSRVSLTICETSSTDDHEWVRGDEAQGLEILSPRRGDEYSVLCEVNPSIVIAPGYADPHFLAALTRFRRERRDCVAVLWSESTAADHRRRAFREAVKARCVSVFDGALVAGRKHAEYLMQLGMAPDRIRVVGNCVDNEFFSTRARAIRTEPRTPIPPYFLFVGRFIPQKNIAGLLEAYDRYRRRTNRNAWPLILVGGGPLETTLKQHVRQRGIPGVTFAGRRQINELPPYYADAGCFVLPSISEPWGLVVNEAMACGLPVLASTRCGCCPELVRDGVNGFTFDPEAADDLASLMERVSGGDVSLEKLGLQSSRIITQFTPEAFAAETEEHLYILASRRRMAAYPLRERLIQTAAAIWCRLN